MTGSDFILSVCLFVCLLQTTHGDGHGGGLRFQCREGWQLYEGVCYMKVEIPTTRDIASATCKRQGGELFLLSNQQQYYDLEGKSVFPSTFWTGISKDDQGQWRNGESMLSLEDVSLWENYEPNEAMGSCIRMDTQKGTSVKSCDNLDNFVCQYDACLQGYVPCALDSKCIKESALCDSVYDCADKSDERNCQAECRVYTLIGDDQVNSGFSTNTISDNTDCLWTLEAPIGKRIRIFVPAMTLEENVAFLRVSSGSPNVEDSRENLWLTGTIDSTYVFSDNNFIHVRIYAGDLAAPIGARTLTWTTDIENEMTPMTQLSSTASYNTLVYPYPSSGPGPYELFLHWRISAPEGQVISYHFMSSTMSGMVQDIYIKDGDMGMYNTRDTNSYYTTATNHLIVGMMYSNVVSEFTLYYKTGCDVAITSAHGKIYSPGDTLNYIPHELSCEWTLNAGQTLNPPKGMTIKFPVIDLAMDPRPGTVSNVAEDTLKVYLDDSANPSVPVQFDDAVTNIIHAPGGKIKLEFQSDVTLNSRKFEAIFGIDCDMLSLSNWTDISTMDTFYEEKVNLMCPTGYQFNLEKNMDDSMVTLECMMDAFVIGMDDNVIPECQIRRCGTPPKINNGFISQVVSTSVGGVAWYNCSQGFNSSTNMVTCNDDGEWSAPPACTSSVCSIGNELTVVNGGYIVEAGNPIVSGQTSAEFNMVVEFYCDPGYEIVGQLRSYCDNNGWSHSSPPTCQKLKCTIPEVANSVPLMMSTVEVDQTYTLSCKEGYALTPNISPTCLSNQTFDEIPECLNVDECLLNLCASATCDDTDGSFVCDCLPGFRKVDDTTCSDIRECDTDNGGCDTDVAGACTEAEGSYSCSCPTGYELFTQNPLHGFSIAASETGLLPGDVFRYNHTCVRLSCPALSNPPNGKYLARDLTSFNYQDRVTLQCADGYYITGMAVQTVTNFDINCQSDGSWDGSPNCTDGYYVTGALQTMTSFDINCLSDGSWDGSPTCTARTCPIPSPPTYGFFDKTTSISYQEMVTLTCNYNSTDSVNRTATCIYDQGTMKLGGENINQCPVISCGTPVLPVGGAYVGGIGPSSNNFLDNPTFQLTCIQGYDLEGGAGNTLNSAIVDCQENGRWNFGTLRCEGKRCTDPGTPVDANQIVSTYEIGQVLYYKCKRSGFVPLMNGVEKNYTCLYDPANNIATWSDNLGPNNLPVCTDMEPPMQSLCQTEIPYYFPMDKIGAFDRPTFTDNFGISRESQISYIAMDDVIINAQQDTYIVFDFQGNNETCDLEFGILNRTVKPALECPSNVTVPIMSSNDGQQDVRDFLISYDNDIRNTLSVNPATIQRTLDTVGTAQIAIVSLTDNYGRSSECTFMIHFTAGVCFEESLYPDSNAVRSCAGTTNGLSCNSTCNNGYIFNDGSSLKTFECTGANSWSFPSDLDIFCLPIENPAFLADVSLKYENTYVASECLDDFKTDLDNTLPTFEGNILAACGLQWDVTVKTEPVRSQVFQFETILQLNLITLSSTSAQRQACIDMANNMTMGIFAFPPNSYICGSNGPQNATVEELTISTPVESCLTSTYNIRDIPNSGKLCLPCGPGFFYDSQTSDCQQCSSDQYQDLIDQVECINCPSATAPDPQQIDCDRTCPEGFSSSDGYYPCEPCPVDCYWVDSKNCTQCPDNKTTVGKKGSVNVDQCKGECPVGCYSETGYLDSNNLCTHCPLGFYQGLTGQMQCLECNADQTTAAEASTSINDCIPLTSCATFGCDPEGTFECEYKFHRPVCICKDGFKGSKCEQKNEICDYNPCADPDRTPCIPVASTNNTDFTCTCRTDLDDCVMDTKSTGVEASPGETAIATITNSINNQNDCENACIANDQCLSAVYVVGNIGVCLLYNKTNLVTQVSSSNTAVYMEKVCTVAFGGDRCEIDLINNCPGQCANGSMCKDMVNSTVCLCPSIGGFSEPYCEPEQDLCANNPCGPNGNCVSFGTVRYQCTCNLGYTGKNCETMIDECAENPDVCLYGGVCSPVLRDYSCNCATGFSGKYCANVPTFCTSNDCLGNVCYDSIDDRDGKCYCEPPLFGNDGMFACNKTALPCDSLLCENGGSCFENSGGLTAFCSCVAGYTGSLCQHNIDDCTSTSCLNGGTCNDLLQTFNCTCPVGFNGTQCENNIQDCPGTCVLSNGGCQDGVNSFTCNCNAGYTGENCEIDINECDSFPCQHNGVCTQDVNSYSCDCAEGWTGTNCELEVDRCDPNPCNNNPCFTIADDFFCRCERGTQGNLCEDPADICNILSDADLCQNGGICQNSNNTAVCICKTEYDVNRCYFEDPLMGISGGVDYTNFTTGATSADFCKDECLKLEYCDGVSFENNACFFYRLVNMTQQANADSTHFNRICPTDYTGDSCEFVKDWCKDSNTCLNGGTCTNLAPKGYRCDCAPGYSGVACEIAADPCSTNPCGNVATCQSNVTNYICQCPEGKVFTGSSCRAPSYDYNMLVNTLNGEQTSCLMTPFRLESDAFSIVLRLRVYSNRTDAMVLHMLSGKSLMPTPGKTNFELMIKTNGIETTHEDHGMASLTFGELNGFGSDLFDGEWHHIGIAVDNKGDMSSTIDAVTSADTVSIGENIDFNDNVQICLGSHLLAEYKDIQVWDYYLSKSDFSLDKVGSFNSLTPPIQGSWNYMLQPSTSRFVGDLQKSPAPNMTEVVPPLNCMGILNPVSYTLNGRFVAMDDVSDITSNLNAIKNNNPGLMFSDTLPSELVWGYHEAIVVGMNDYDNYAECRFPVYIKFNNQCPAPTTQSNDVSFNSCPSGDGVCSVSCNDNNNEGVAAALPRYLPCTELGVFYSQEPYDDLVLPACNPKSSPKYVATSSMQFRFVIDCVSVNLDNVQTVLLNTFQSLRNTSWPDICTQSDCSDIQFTTASCSANSATPRHFNLTFVLTLDNDHLTYSSSSGTVQVKTEDALRIIIKLDKNISLSDFGSGVLLKDTVEIMESKVCTTSGSALIWENGIEICVPCGPGRYYMGTVAENGCMLCERGTYQDQLGQMSCTACGNDANGNPRTTYQRGAVSQADCVSVCPPGQYYDESMNMCMNCSRHYYQDEEGQNYCKPCQVGFKTVGEGSDNSTDCKEDCPAGQYRDGSTQACLNCSRGTWRSLQYDDCQPCTVGKTTMLGVLGVSLSSCSMDNCTAGTYWNGTICLDCEVGYYQSEIAMMECEKCPKNYTTRNAGEDMESDCLFYCAVGYETDDSSVDTCKPCERGKYKDNNGMTKFDACQMCSVNTTDIIAATSNADCFVPICDPGEVIVNGICSKCPKDTYSEVDMPYTSTQCVECTDECDICGNLYGTNITGASNRSQCMLYCRPGYELINGDCKECQRGFYKDNVDDTSRFGLCLPCSTSNTMTTDIMGAISFDNCTVPVCSAGQEIVNGACRNCSMDTYQPINSPLTTETSVCSAGQEIVNGACSNCSLDTYQPINVPLTTENCQSCQPIESVPTGTRQVGTSSASHCLPICVGGKQFNNSTNTCTDCPMGSYKPANLRFDACIACNETFTTNGAGADSESDCNIRNCQPGTFINQTLNDCQACPIGTYQEQPRQTSCEECGENLSTETPGASNFTQCQIFCNPGLQGETIAGTTDKECRLCPEHFFKNQSGLTNCEECPPNLSSNDNRTACTEARKRQRRLCPEHLFKNQSGLTNCETCPPNLSSNDERTVCTEVYCYFGFEYNSTANSCQECDVGFYKNTKGNTDMCTQCTPGYTTDGTGQSACTLRFCVPGEYFDSSINNCTKCSIGTYKMDAGNQACTNCSANSTTLIEGATMESQCDISICPVGQYRNPPNKGCSLCELNRYQDEVGQLTCKNCSAGNITLAVESTLATDCVPECLLGQQYVSSSKSCTPCPDGTYKNVTGNAENACTACPIDKTTVGQGSISQANCSETVCPIGTQADSSSGTIVCQACPVGTYNSERGQKSCTSCGNTQTTLAAGADSIADCKELCNPGSGYSFLTNRCELCPRGSLNNKQGIYPNLCQPCPDNFTNLQAGSTTCDLSTTPVVTTGFINYKVTLIYQVTVEDCQSAPFSVIEEQICNRVRSFLKFVEDTTFTRPENKICGDDTCSNIGCALDPSSCSPLNGRRKRQATSQKREVSVDVAFNNVSETLTDNTGSTYSFDTAVSSLLTTESANLTAVPGSIVYASFENATSTPICAAGQRLVNNVCGACEIGTYEENGICRSCPADTFQNLTGQTMCNDCPDNTYNDDLASPSEASCLSFCAENVLYCNNRGTCFVTGRRTARCECFEDFSGNRCESKDEPESNTTVIIAAAIGGGGALLVLILVAVGVYRYMASNDLKKKKKKQQYTPDFEDASHFYERNAYDNFTMTTGSNMPRRYAQYPSIGYPALGYRPDTSFDENGFHNVYKKAPSMNGDPNQDTFVWQA